MGKGLGSNDRSDPGLLLEIAGQTPIGAPSMQDMRKGLTVMRDAITVVVRALRSPASKMIHHTPIVFKDVVVGRRLPVTVADTIVFLVAARLHPLLVSTVIVEDTRTSMTSPNEDPITTTRRDLRLDGSVIGRHLTDRYPSLPLGIAHLNLTQWQE